MDFVITCKYIYNLTSCFHRHTTTGPEECNSGSNKSPVRPIATHERCDLFLPHSRDAFPFYKVRYIVLHAAERTDSTKVAGQCSPSIHVCTVIVTVYECFLFSNTSRHEYSVFVSYSISSNYAIRLVST